jgi:hypothetical protein
MTESSNEEVKTILVPVSDIEKAKALYSALLGAAPGTTPPTASAPTPKASTLGWCRAASRRV